MLSDKITQTMPQIWTLQSGTNDYFWCWVCMIAATMKLPSFDIKNFGPLKQGALCMLLVTLFSLGSWILHVKSIQSWSIILSPIFIYSVYNPIIGAFREKKPWTYVAWSLLMFIVLGMYIYISGTFVSDISYRESDELHRFTALAIIFYFLVNILCLMFRGVIYMLEHMDEWS